MEKEHLHALTEAARSNDALAEEHGMAGASRIIGIELDDVVHMAEQRAMRAMLLKFRGKEELAAMSQVDATLVTVTEEEDAYMTGLIALYMDGIYLGWRAHEIHVGDR